MKKTIQKKFFVSEIIASELIALKLSPLKREYLSSTANVLTNSPKIFHIPKTDFLPNQSLHSDQHNNKGTVV